MAGPMSHACTATEQVVSTVSQIHQLQVVSIDLGCIRLNQRVRVWLHDTYDVRTSIIQLDDILGHVVIADVKIDGVERWVSVIANRVRQLPIYLLSLADWSSQSGSF